MTRANDLFTQYLELGSLAKVGKNQNPPISRERVRQILKDYDTSRKVLPPELRKEHRREYLREWRRKRNG